MVIGLKHGKTMMGDDAATEKTRAIARKFMQEFAHRHGSVNCTELLGYDLSNPAECILARDSRLFFTKCPELVRDAVAILEKIL